MFKKTILALIFLLNANITFAFSDVAEDFKFSRAIKYLSENNIINGYQDGSFKPLNNINRAEALKIIMLSSNLDLTGETSCFSDVQNDAWYENYVCTAKTYGLINGFEGNLFKPNQEISRAEALKITMEVMDVKTNSNFVNINYDVKKDDWFYKYAVSSMAYNISPFYPGLLPNKSIQRGELSEILYRTLQSPDEIFNYEEQNSAQSNLSTEQESPKINKDFFEGIVLDDSFTNEFYKGTTKLIKGKVTEPTNAVFIAFKIEGVYKDVVFVPVLNSEFEYIISVPEEDDLELMIYTKNTKLYKAMNVMVKEPLSNVSDLNGISIDFGFDKNPFIDVDGLEGILKLEFEDSDLSKEIYLIDSGKTFIPPDFFKGFEKGNLKYKVYGSSLLKESSIEISENHFSTVSEGVSVSNLPSIYKVGEEVEIQVTSEQALRSGLYLTTPIGKVEKILPNNTDEDSYSYRFQLKDDGVYFIEINQSGGFAAINHPVYSENIWPVLPDFRTSDRAKTTIADEEIAISDSLNQINQLRSRVGVGQISTDPLLNKLAQYHANNMVTYNFYSHTDHLGEGPNQRRHRFDIKTSLGENLSLSSYGGFNYAFNSLLRSGAHRLNMINKDWNKVGIGAKFSNGKLYYVQVFSE